MAGVHEGDRLYHDGLDDREDARAPDPMSGQCSGHHRWHGQWYSEGLHTRRGGEYFLMGGLEEGMLSPGDALRCDGNFREEGEPAAEGGSPACSQ